MQLSDIIAGSADQDRGRWFELLHPVTGAATGIALLVAGPDSRVQAEALAAMTDDLAEMSDADGRVSGASRAECHIRLLSRCILDWRAVEDGKPVPFSSATLARVLRVAWVKAQVDAFAGSRAPYFPPEPEIELVGADDAKA
jgi:hypothetical protein